MTNILVRIVQIGRVTLLSIIWAAVLLGCVVSLILLAEDKGSGTNALRVFLSLVIIACIAWPVLAHVPTFSRWLDKLDDLLARYSSLYDWLSVQRLVGLVLQLAFAVVATVGSYFLSRLTWGADANDDDWLIWFKLSIVVGCVIWAIAVLCVILRRVWRQLRSRARTRRG